MQLIASRVFTLADQQRFALWSGDANPMHMDPAAARRTQAGAPAVHGVHALLWALDQLPGERPIRKISARFDKFMTVDQTIELRLADGEKAAKLELRGPNARTAVVTVTYGDPARQEPEAWPAADELAAEPVVRGFEDARSAEGAFVMARADFADAFPRLGKRCSQAQIQGLMALSTLVGMVCPGLHSIFSSLTVQLVAPEPEAPPVLAWRAVEGHEAFSLVSMVARAPGVVAELEAFLRPAPVQQPKLVALLDQVAPQAFAEVRALIVGGSRGLGEVTAKLLAAGGAEVAVTYATGKTEAEALAAEFAGAGKSLAILPFDARRPAASQLAAAPFRPTHVFYFATSKIFRQKGGLFAPDLLAEFNQIYSTAFFEICEFYSGGDPVRVFYPSSVAVEERPRDMTEYAMAKAAGEVLCADIERWMSGISVLRYRLPRLATDQTATVTAVENVSSVDVMREIVDAMCAGSPAAG
jgi:hypothetical protein